MWSEKRLCPSAVSAHAWRACQCWNRSSGNLWTTGGFGLPGFFDLPDQKTRSQPDFAGWKKTVGWTKLAGVAVAAGRTGQETSENQHADLRPYLTACQRCLSVEPSTQISSDSGTQRTCLAWVGLVIRMTETGPAHLEGIWTVIQTAAFQLQEQHSQEFAPVR